MDTDARLTFGNCLCSAHDTHTRNSSELTRARNLYVCHTNKIFASNRVCSISCKFFGASFLYEFLVYLSWAKGCGNSRFIGRFIVRKLFDKFFCSLKLYDFVTSLTWLICIFPMSWRGVRFCPKGTYLQLIRRCEQNMCRSFVSKCNVTSLPVWLAEWVLITLHNFR